MNTAKIVLYYLIIIFVNLLCVESMAYYAGKYLESKNILYKEQENFDDFEEYVKNRHPVLGWVCKNDIDAKGARSNPAYPDAVRFQACVSLYGDSVTWGAEVDNAHAWSHVLSLLLGCRVDNYGVGGYGTDQAYLRFKLNKDDKSRVVILGFLPENIFRNVNQFRNLLYPNHRYALKPRFILDHDGSLELIPLLMPPKEQYISIVKEPERFLKHEYFFLQDFGQVSRLKFPYTLSVLKVMNHYYLYAKIAGKPTHTDFYDKQHKSGALTLTYQIIKNYYDDALLAGKTPIVLIIPTYDDLKYYKKYQQWVYQNLVDLLGRGNIKTYNAGHDLLNKIGTDKISNYFTKSSDHFNDAGNKILAEVVSVYLKENVTPDFASPP
jgi:hypothetical protein